MKMVFMKKLIIQLIIRLVLAAVGISGIVITVISSSSIGQSKAFLYFTIQSNITIILVELLFAFDALLQLLGKKSFVSNAHLLVKYLFTVAITITFLVFVSMLAPTLGMNYLLSYGNFSLHFIVPILALIDFFVFNNDIRLTKFNCLFGIAMPIYYMFFFLAGIPLGVRYINNDIAPYFFLNYEQITWFNFTSKGPGVFYWLIILTAGIVGLCYLFYLFMWLRQKPRKKV